MLLHRSGVNISAKFRQTFSHFSAICFAKIRHFWILFFDFCSDFDEILSEFRRYFRKCWIFLKFLSFLARCIEFWKNSDRTPIWIVRLVRSLADRTFQPRWSPEALFGFRRRRPPVAQGWRRAEHGCGAAHQHGHMGRLWGGKLGTTEELSSASIVYLAVLSSQSLRLRSLHICLIKHLAVQRSAA